MTYHWGCTSFFEWIWVCLLRILVERVPEVCNQLIGKHVFQIWWRLYNCPPSSYGHSWLSLTPAIHPAAYILLKVRPWFYSFQGSCARRSCACLACRHHAAGLLGYALRTQIKQFNNDYFQCHFKVSTWAMSLTGNLFTKAFLTQKVEIQRFLRTSLSGQEERISTGGFFFKPFN